MRCMRVVLVLLLLGAAGCVAPQSQRKLPARPNILVIMADDLGFSDVGCFGGDIRTPNLDHLGTNGLRFTQFYNTARCWPTRSALMTGYYPQQINMDPAGNKLPAWTRLMPHYLKPLGYRCYHSGKWHVNPIRKIVADGGFDHSYVLDDHNRNFYPRQHQEDDVALPAVQPAEGYYSSTAMADHAIKYLREHAEKYADQPFFTYLAFTVPHFPLHAPVADVERYLKSYDKGWDIVREQRWQRLRDMGIVDCALSPLEKELAPRHFKPATLGQLGEGEVGRALSWDDLTDAQKHFQATKMAIHAAMVDRMDQEIGRVLEQIRAMKAFENTLVLFMSDNGASSEMLVRGDGHDPAAAPGSAGSFLCLGPGWSSAANTPFRRHKIWNHEGGISTPLIVHWPDGIAERGTLRHDPGHVIDILPTLVEVAGGRITPLSEMAPPFPGRSLVPDFASDGHVQRDYLFFKHEGNRALRVSDWKLVSASEDGGDWSLYNLRKDRCETKDLSKTEAARVEALGRKWDEADALFRQQAGPR